MGWVNPVPDGFVTRGMGPTPNIYDAAMYALPDQSIAREPPFHGPFPGSYYYPHYHAALDVAAGLGAPIYAPQSGLVLEAQWGSQGSWANGGGLYLRVQVNPKCFYLMAHCSTLLVPAGVWVSRGQLIARVGATGFAFGNHLHFVVRLGPTAIYYHPEGFFYNPKLVLPGGALYGDGRFELSGQPAPSPVPVPPPPPAIEDEILWIHMLQHIEPQQRTIKPNVTLYKGPGREYKVHATLTVAAQRLCYGLVDRSADASAAASNSKGLWFLFQEADGVGAFFAPNSGLQS